MNMTLKELEQSLTPERIIELVTGLGADRYKEENDYIIFPTICHNVESKDASMKLYYYKKNHRFHCYTDCGENFNIYTLFEKRYKLLGQEYEFYKDIVLVVSKGIRVNKPAQNGFGKAYESPYAKYKKEAPDVYLPEVNKNILQMFSSYPAAEWLEDGISAEVMKAYNIKYSIDQNKVIIPHYDIDGYLVGIRGRTLNDDELEYGKYLPLQIEGKTYSHPLMYNLYGLNMVKDNIRRTGNAIIAEGEKSALQYGTKVGMKNNICVACCGSTVHDYQIDLLLRAGAKKVIVAFDKEGETWNEKCSYFDKLRAMCKKYSHKIKIGFIYDSKNLLQLKQSPFDVDFKITRQLFQGVKWV